MPISISEQLIKYKGIEIKGEDSVKKSFSKAVHEIVKHLTNEKNALIQDIRLGKYGFDVLKSEIEDYIDDTVLSVKGYSRTDLVEGVKNWLFLYFDYQKLLDNPYVTEIRLKNRKCTIITVIDENGNEYPKIFDETPIFDTDEEYSSFCTYIATRNEAELNKKNAIQNFTDETKCRDGILRINVVNGNLVAGGSPTVIFAKTPRNKKSTDELSKLGMFNEEIQRYYEEAAEAGLNMIIGGAGGAGKTNLTNALLEFVPDYMNTLVIQKDLELHSKKKNMIFERINGEYGLKDLSLNAMKQRIELFVIGELEGAETFDFFNAAYSGHKVWATIHFETPEEMINKCLQYIEYGDKKLREETLVKMLCYMDVVTLAKNFTCFEITEIAGYDSINRKIIYNPVFRYDFKNNIFIKLNDSCERVKRKKEYSRKRKEKLDEMATKRSGEKWLKILKNRKE